ncbi:MAG TPA: class I SAM-dependent methyltransferase [Moraxellaceae bacterium]|nr:class I SAM-dependent methyltransferase [Moraxellaceae bacterium]
MSQQHEAVVERQFGSQASAYLTSTVHSQGAEFDRLRALVAEQPRARVLDLGCGAGHVAFQVAPLVAEVVAYDLSADMLSVVKATAGERGLSNVAVQQGVVEQLPFEDGSFDVVFSRYSAHHWSDLGLGLREARRVLKPGGVFAFIDVASPGQPLLDTYLQTVEVLRDTSHVRDYSVGEWLARVSEAGLRVEGHVLQRLRLEFGSWVERMRTPDVYRSAIRELQGAMSVDVRHYFEIESDGSFTTDVVVLWGKC